MKIIILLDQMQSGLGGDEQADTELGGKKLAMGVADTFDRILKKKDSEVMATFFCGTKYFFDNRDVVKGKITRMCQKMQPDVLVVGPTYDYDEFAWMACEIGSDVQKDSDIPVVAMVALENNSDVIDQFKRDLNIIKMPKKGGTGLTTSIDNCLELCELKTKRSQTSEFVTEHCY